jgi:hypothetical protein
MPVFQRDICLIVKANDRKMHFLQLTDRLRYTQLSTFALHRCFMDGCAVRITISRTDGCDKKHCPVHARATIIILQKILLGIGGILATLEVLVFMIGEFYAV